MKHAFPDALRRSVEHDSGVRGAENPASILQLISELARTPSGISDVAVERFAGVQRIDEDRFQAFDLETEIDVAADRQALAEIAAQAMQNLQARAVARPAPMNGARRSCGKGKRVQEIPKGEIQSPIHHEPPRAGGVVVAKQDDGAHEIGIAEPRAGDEEDARNDPIDDFQALS